LRIIDSLEAPDPDIKTRIRDVFDLLPTAEACIQLICHNDIISLCCW
jgi:hypothetical protein